MIMLGHDNNNIQTRVSTTSARAIRVLATVPIITVLGALLAGGVLAAGGHRARHTHGTAPPRLSLFAHPLARQARIASAGVANMPPAGPRVRILSAADDTPPADAKLAASLAGDEIYAWQPSSGEEERPVISRLGTGGKVCIMERESSMGITGVACYLNSTLESVGAMTVNLPSRTAPTLGITAIVPNNVTRVVTTDSDGSSSNIGVTDNVAVINDSQLASVSYQLPNGTTHTVNIQELASASTTATPPPPGG